METEEDEEEEIEAAEGAAAPAGPETGDEEEESEEEEEEEDYYAKLEAEKKVYTLEDYWEPLRDRISDFDVRLRHEIQWYSDLFFDLYVCIFFFF